VPHAVNATLYDKLNYNFARDIAPVTGLIRVPNVMEVNPSFPAKTVPELGLRPRDARHTRQRGSARG
jgi:hypothetical protein